MSKTIKKGKKSKSVAPRGDKEGYLLFSQDDASLMDKSYVVLKGNTLLTYINSKDTTPTCSFNIENATVTPVGINCSSSSLNYDIKLEKVGDYSIFIKSDNDVELNEWSSSLLRGVLKPLSSMKNWVYRDSLVDRELLMTIPLVTNVPAHEARAVIHKKLQMCCVLFTFTDPGGVDLFATQKLEKRNTLIELVEVCNAKETLFNELKCFQDVVLMISTNIFRSMPYKPNLAGEDDDEDDPFLEPGWPHLAIVYELLVNLVTCSTIDITLKKKVLDSSFLNSLLELFKSEDVREREYLKTITHRIYGKLTNRRAAIRRAIKNVFFEFIYETGKHHGISELLEILASIINGFAVPIKDEHKQMLITALIPLHKAVSIASFHPQLQYCMNLYAAKESKLALAIIGGLLKYWPYGCSSKEILFLNELDDLFDHVNADELKESPVTKKLYIRLAHCISGQHFQVTERTLWLWNNATIIHLFVEDATHRDNLLPMIFDNLCLKRENHWNESVKGLAEKVLAMYMEADSNLYMTLESNYKQK